MNVTPRVLCLFVALVLFVAAALWTPARFGLTPAGLAFLTLAQLVPG